jgi:hypothetical protein
VKTFIFIILDTELSVVVTGESLEEAQAEAIVVAEDLGYTYKHVYLIKTLGLFESTVIYGHNHE